MGTVAQWLYRNLFIAQFGSNIGTLMQSVAAQWFLVEKHSSDVVVALVQTASLGPTLLLGLFAGVLADLFDRRRLLIVPAVVCGGGGAGPGGDDVPRSPEPDSAADVHLGHRLASALTGPAWQAIQPEVVPREQIPAVSTLGSVSANAARAIGPAIGGVVVCIGRPRQRSSRSTPCRSRQSSLPWSWKRPKQLAPLEREHFGQAIVSGLLYVVTPEISAGSCCARPFSCFPPRPCWLCCRWSPPTGGTSEPVDTVWRLGAIGLGAVLAVVIRHAATSKSVGQCAAGGIRCGLRACAAGGYLAAVCRGDAILGVVGDGVADHADDVERGSAAVAAAVGSGPRVVGVSAGLPPDLRRSAPMSGVPWPRGRDCTSRCGSALVLGVVALSVVVLPLRPSTGKLSVEVSAAWPTPTLMFEPCPEDGPVLVTVRYRVPAENLEKFAEAMIAVRRSRLRTGGHSWRLYHSVGQPNTFLERFTVASWTEFERQRTERWLEYDTDGVMKAIGYTVDRTRQHEYFLAVRVRR